MKKLIRVSYLLTEIEKQNIAQLSYSVKNGFVKNYIEAGNNSDNELDVISNTLQELYNEDLVRFSIEQEEQILNLHREISQLHMPELSNESGQKLLSCLQDGSYVYGIDAENITVKTKEYLIIEFKN